MTTRVLPLVAAVAYLVAPGHPDLPFRGIPLGVSGSVAAVALITLAWWARAELPFVRHRSRIAVLLIAMVALKAAIGFAAPPSGWHARYYANEDFAPPVERSIDFRDLNGTRIDRAVDFVDTQFPVHFFNEWRFAQGFRREYTEPFSVHWTGHAYTAVARPMTFGVEARGSVRIAVDGASVIELSSPASIERRAADITVAQGDHLIEVWYRKPANTEGIVKLTDDPEVTPTAVPPWRRAMRRPLAVAGWVVHALALVISVAWLAPAVRQKASAVAAAFPRTRLDALDQLAGPALIAALVAQGVWKARHLIDHVWTLTGGDDWLAYEMHAREIVLNGIMMTPGVAPGEGAPYFYYPGYIHFVALVHAITGESIAGVIVVNFLVLALATLMVYRLARVLVGPGAALVALVWLLLIEQAAFTRYYTVTLLSENLFFFTAAATVLGLTLHLTGGRLRHLLWAALAGGISALTRPSIMLFLPCAAALILAHGWRRGTLSRGAALAALFVAVWLAAVAPATVRNYIMSGRLVLISAGQAGSFIVHNLPPDNAQHYIDGFGGDLVSVPQVLLQIAIEQPRAFFGSLFTKIGFSLGMVHWIGSSPHPELVLTSVAYLLSLILVPQARKFATLPLHLFVVTHLATLMLTNPSIYGYRLLLAMYLFMPVLAVVMPLRFLPRRAG